MHFLELCTQIVSVAPDTMCVKPCILDPFLGHSDGLRIGSQSKIEPATATAQSMATSDGQKGEPSRSVPP